MFGRYGTDNLKAFSQILLVTIHITQRGHESVHCSSLCALDTLLSVFAGELEDRIVPVGRDTTDISECQLEIQQGARCT